MTPLVMLTTINPQPSMHHHLPHQIHQTSISKLLVIHGENRWSSQITHHQTNEPSKSTIYLASLSASINHHSSINFTMQLLVISASSITIQALSASIPHQNSPSRRATILWHISAGAMEKTAVTCVAWLPKGVCSGRFQAAATGEAGRDRRTVESLSFGEFGEVGG